MPVRARKVMGMWDLLIYRDWNTEVCADQEYMSYLMTLDLRILKHMKNMIQKNLRAILWISLKRCCLT
jgi:hypothetical protein